MKRIFIFLMIILCSISFCDGVLNVAWLSDTQWYSEKYPGIWRTVSNYIAESDFNFVAHSGDIVQTYNRSREWMTASHWMYDLPVLFDSCAGNHDNNSGADNSWYGTYFRKTYSNLYGDYYFVFVNYGATLSDFSVYQSYITANASKKVIIVCHSYLYTTGSYTADGQRIYDNLVENNSCVFMVWCGHEHGVFYRAKNVNGRIVHEIMRNYQAETNGGNGYIVQVSFSDNDVHFVTYSPYIDQYINGDELTIYQ